MSRGLTRFAASTILLTNLLAAASSARGDSEVWTYWQAHDNNNNTELDHSAWQAFLSRYVHPNEDGIHRIAYQQAAQDNAQYSLSQYLATLTELDPRALASVEQLAYWINLYNALTVDVVLKHPTKSGIKRMGGWFSLGPWDKTVISINGQDLTLNDIEHRILRPIWKDHRIHYAVNCASLGCPNLSPLAYTRNNVEQQLNTSEKAYINHIRGVSLAADGRLTVSSIFTWYRDDFATDDSGLLTYLAAHHDEISDSLNNYRRAIRYDYDWTLNSVIPRN